MSAQTAASKRQKLGEPVSVRNLPQVHCNLHRTDQSIESTTYQHIAGLKRVDTLRETWSIFFGIRGLVGEHVIRVDSELSQRFNLKTQILIIRADTGISERSVVTLWIDRCHRLLLLRFRKMGTMTQAAWTGQQVRKTLAKSRLEVAIEFPKDRPVMGFQQCDIPGANDSDIDQSWSL